MARHGPLTQRTQAHKRTILAEDELVHHRTAREFWIQQYTAAVNEDLESASNLISRTNKCGVKVAKCGDAMQSKVKAVVLTSKSRRGQPSASPGMQAGTCLSNSSQ